MTRTKVAFVKFGGLSAGGTERWLQMMAANLPRDLFEVDYYYCDSAPYLNYNYRHADTDPHRLAYMKAAGVNLIKFTVAAKDITTPTHDWLETDFWQLFDESKYDLVQTAKAGPPEYPYNLMKIPVVEYLTLRAGVDHSSNIAWSLHLSQWQRSRWVADGGSLAKSSVITIPVLEPASNDNLRAELAIPEGAIVAGMHQRVDDHIFSEIPLAAFAKLNHQGSYFLIMGGGSWYRKQAQDLGLSNVIFLEHSADPLQISKFLNTLDIFAHGRYDGETFGAVLAEAMIHGKACLSHRSSIANAQPETMAAGGLFANNLDEYTIFLNKLMSEQDLRLNLGREAKLHATRYYSLESCVDSLTTLYCNLLGLNYSPKYPAKTSYTYSSLGFLLPSSLAEEQPDLFSIKTLKKFLAGTKNLTSIGSSSNVYSLVAAKLLPQAKTSFFNLDAEAQQNLELVASLNNWQDRLSINNDKLNKESVEVLLARKTDFINISGDEFLLDNLRVLTPLLSQDKPVLFIKITAKITNESLCLSYLEHLGYKLWCSNDNAWLSSAASNFLTIKPNFYLCLDQVAHEQFVSNSYRWRLALWLSQNLSLTKDKLHKIMHKLLAIINNPKKLARVIKYQLLTLIYENKDSADDSYLVHDSQLRSAGKLAKEIDFIADLERKNYFGAGWLNLDKFLQAHPEIKQAVDIGSGNGWLSARLIREGFESVQAIEPSAAGITIAKTINQAESYQKITWINDLAERALAKLNYESKQLFFTGTVLSHLPNDSVEKICEQVNEKAALGSILMFEEAWCEKWFDEYHHTTWHVRPKAWWQKQLSNWDLVFDGPSIPGHGHRKLFRGVKVRNDQPSAKPHFSYLDALRGLAVALVLFIHTVGYASAPVWYRNFWMAGKNGVMLFFMISALTLFMSLDHKFSKEKKPLKNFFLRRFFRVAPLYYLGVIFYFWFDYHTGEFLYGIKPTLQIALANVFFVHGLVPLWANAYVPGGWTISAEFVFYALIPLLYKKIKSANAAIWFFIVALIIRIIAVGSVRLFMDTSSNFALAEWPYYFFPNQLPVFALGILLYFIIKEKASSSIKPLTIFISSLFLIINIAMSNTLPTHILFSLGFLMLIWAMSQRRIILIDNRFFIYLGKISFGVYLIHFAIITCLNKTAFYQADSMLFGLLRFVVVLALSSLIATLTYYFIERPMQAIGQKLINKSENS